jgi:predicted amidohydrolase
MSDLKITLVQADQKWEDKLANLANYDQLLLNVETDLIVLPEMFHTGFSMNVNELFETNEKGVGIEWLLKTSKEKNAAIYTSLIIKENESFYNRGVFVEPSGKITTYDKRKSFGLAKEDLFFTAGTGSTIVNYKGVKIQLQICYDLRFPEIVRNEINSNGEPMYDLICYVANWPEKRALHWKTLLQARAIENQCYVAGVNRVGIDANNLVYSGDCTFTDALGNKQALKNNLEEIATFVINLTDLNKIREMLPFLNDR